MSYTVDQERYLADWSADLDLAIAEAVKHGTNRKFWNEAQAVVDAVREQGYEHEADIMRKSLLRAQADWADDKEARMKRVAEMEQKRKEAVMERITGQYFQEV